MTNEKMLEILTALATCDGFNEKAIAQMTADNRPSNESAGMPYRAEAILTNAIKTIKKDIITAEAKKSGNGARQKVVDYIIKSVISRPWVDDRLTRQHKSKTTGKYYITDSYILLEQEKPFDGVEEETENPMDAARLIPDGDGEKVTLPEAPALSAWIKSEKSRLKAEGKKKDRLIFDLENDAPAFDAELLLKAIEASGRAETMTVYGKLRTAVITGADENRVAICPVKVQPGTPCGTMQDIQNMQ